MLRLRPTDTSSNYVELRVNNAIASTYQIYFPAAVPTTGARPFWVDASGNGSWGDLAAPITVTANTTLTANAWHQINGTSRLNVALPANSTPVGSWIRIDDFSGNGWQITQAASQQIRIPIPGKSTPGTTTAGTAGFLNNPISSGIEIPNSQYCSIALVCVSTGIWQVREFEMPIYWE